MHVLQRGLANLPLLLCVPIDAGAVLGAHIAPLHTEDLSAFLPAHAFTLFAILLPTHITSLQCQTLRS